MIPPSVPISFYQRALRDCPQSEDESFHDHMVRVGERAKELADEEQRAGLPYKDSGENE